MSMKILPWLKKHRHDPAQGETPVRYSDLGGIPKEFPPKTHGHKWDEITETPDEYPPASHNHQGSGLYSVQIAGSATGQSAVQVGIYGTATKEGAVAVGYSADATGSYSTIVGCNGLAAYPTSSGLGYGVAPTSSNQVILGRSTETVVLGDGTAVTSDKRDKINIEDNDMGLDSILKIRTVKYQANHRDRYYQRDKDGKLLTDKNGRPIIDNEAHKSGAMAGKRIHRGVIAQEILAIFDSKEFSAVKSNTVNNPDALDTMQVNYLQFIPLLIKAVQELSDKIDKLGG